MAEIPEIKESLQESLQQIIHLLDKQSLVEDLVHKQELDSPKQNLVESLVHTACKVQRLESRLNGWPMRKTILKVGASHG